MGKTVRQLVAPAYLFLCLVLGGSAQGMWGNLVLQLLGLGLIGWAASSRHEQPLLPAARQLFYLVMLALALVILQLVPLPASIWSHMGGRAQLAAGYDILGVRAPALPVSVTPYDTLDALLKFIPPLAILCALLRLKAYRPVWMALALVAGALAGIGLGALQVSTGDPATSPWYLYAQTNSGAAVGFFANANHMASLLLISLPFIAALLPAARSRNVQRYSAFVAVAVGAGLMILLGLALNRSLAADGLVGPVLLGSMLLLLSPQSGVRKWVAAIAGILLCAAVAGISFTNIGNNESGLDAASTVQSRSKMLATTGTAAKDFMPLGSGLGSFKSVYPLYEDPATVTPTYAIHAHDDYAELALELGIPGILLIIAFLAWWGVAVWRVWRSAEAGPFVRAASIASAAVLAHSAVDFPLRTGAISACFAFCVALLADRRAPQVLEASDLRPARHLAFH